MPDVSLHLLSQSYFIFPTPCADFVVTFMSYFTGRQWAPPSPWLHSSHCNQRSTAPSTASRLFPLISRKPRTLLYFMSDDTLWKVDLLLQSAEPVTAPFFYAENRGDKKLFFGVSCGCFSDSLCILYTCTIVNVKVQIFCIITWMLTFIVPVASGLI